MESEQYDLAEINVQLKEDIDTLQKAYTELLRNFQYLLNTPHIMLGNLQLLSLTCSEQTKAQRGEESTQVKFDDVESFSKYINMMIDLSIKHIEREYRLTK